MKKLLIFSLVIIFMYFIYNIITPPPYSKYELNKKNTIEGFAATTPLDDLAAINALAQIATSMNTSTGFTFPSNAVVTGKLTVNDALTVGTMNIVNNINTHTTDITAIKADITAIKADIATIKDKTNNITGDYNGITRINFVDSYAISYKKTGTGKFPRLYITRSDIPATIDFTLIKSGEILNYGNTGFVEINDIEGNISYGPKLKG